MNKSIFFILVFLCVEIFPQEKLLELYNLSIQYYQNGNYEMAVKYGKATLIEYEKEYGIFDNEDYALLKNNLALLYNSTGNYREAEPLYIEALEMYRRLFKEDHPDLAQSINNMAHFYDGQGDYTKAEPLYIEALEMNRRLFKEDHPHLANSINNMAYFYNGQGDYTKAEPLYIEALEMNRRLYKKDHSDLALSINNMALFYNTQGNFTKAEPLYIEALEMNRRLFKEDHPHLANSINNMAYFYDGQGDYTKAEPLYIEALEMYRRLFKEDNPDLARSINNMALFYNTQGNFTKAEPLYIEALEMYRRLFKEDHPDLARSINNIAYFYDGHGDYTKAEPLYIEALEMYRRLFKEVHPHLATSINNMALLYNTQDNFTKAEPLYIEALDMYRRLFKEDHPDLARGINNMAHFYDGQGNYTKAESLYVEALTVYKNMLNNYRASLSENELNQFLKTFSYHFEFFNSFHYLHQTEITANQQANNCLFTKGLMLNQSKNVFAAVLQSKDSSLIKTYNLWQQERNILSKLYTKTKPELEEMNINLDSLEKKVNDLEKQLSRSSATLNNFFTEKEKSWEDIRDKLQNSEAAIDITRFSFYDKKWTDSVFYSFTIITKETKTPKTIYLTNGNEMEQKIFLKYRASIRDEKLYGSDEITDSSYNFFWLHLADELNDINKIYISLDGIYNKISLPSLKNNLTGKYLYEEYDIVLVNNLKDILNIKSDKTGYKTAELFGYPNYDLSKSEQEQLALNYTGENRDIFIDSFTRDGLERFHASLLPGTKEEIEMIDSLFSKENWSSNKYLWNDALEEAVKGIKESPRVLVISTHGFFLDDPDREKEENRIMGMEQSKVYENPLLRSGLLLAGATTFLNLESKQGYDKIDNGILTAYEVSQLNLINTELVVLSACETGLGEIQNGEGVYGLQRAFTIAGADAVLMSLWKVDDNATKDFMISFFNSWIKNGNKNLALNTARNEIREKYIYPYYWAAFVLIGL